MTDVIEIVEVTVDTVYTEPDTIVIDQVLEQVEVTVVTTDVVLETGLVAPAPAAYASYHHAVSATVAYQAEAPVGSAPSAAVWRIRKLEELSGGITRVLWAGASSAFTHIWDDRATYTYS